MSEKGMPEGIPFLVTKMKYRETELKLSLRKQGKTMTEIHRYKNSKYQK